MLNVPEGCENAIKCLVLMNLVLGGKETTPYAHEQNIRINTHPMNLKYHQYFIKSESGYINIS